MAQFYKIAAMSFAITLTSTGSALALGLGEVSWKSTLNQPLNAEIALYDIKGISSAELAVTLADDAAFQKAGIERSYVLSDLVFTPVLHNGKGIIKITSRNPIKEPYLDFLLSVTWASGKTLREYTLLIDPPAYVPATVTRRQPAPLPPPTTVSKAPPPPLKQPTVAKKPTQPAGNKTPAPTAAKKPASKPAPQSGDVRVAAGDSLWAIAERSRGNASVHQAMYSIYQENTDAFIGGDMSRLKRGRVLRIPNNQQMRTQSRSEALAQVLQNVNNKGTVTARQVAASKPGTVAKPAKKPGDELTLVAGNGDNSKPANGNSNNNKLIADLSVRATQVEENIDAIHRKNDELRSRLKDLQSQLGDMKGLIMLRDNQLAALQANIAKKSAEQESQEKPQTAPNTEETNINEDQPILLNDDDIVIQ